MQVLEPPSNLPSEGTHLSPLHSYSTIIPLSSPENVPSLNNKDSKIEENPMINDSSKSSRGRVLRRPAYLDDFVALATKISPSHHQLSQRLFDRHLKIRSGLRQCKRNYKHFMIIIHDSLYLVQMMLMLRDKNGFIASR